MSTPFRKSLFGFHTQDVTNYIADLQQEAKRRQDVLNDSLNDTRRSLEQSQARLAVANEMNEVLSRKVARYEEQINGIRTMSEAISRLYLVTQSSCDALLNGAKEERAVADVQTAEQLQTLREAKQAFADAKAQMDRLADEVAGQVASVDASLADTEEKLAALQDRAEEVVQAYLDTRS